MKNTINIKKGSRIKNRYEIISLLGEGGFGKTYKAVDNLINRFVAIKVSKSNLSHEARILKELRNVPHISHIYDYFVENQMHFIVMRYIEGVSLTKYLYEHEKTISTNLLLEFIPSILITLDQMHKHGIVHRDISPGNLILTNELTLYLIDFGTATSLKNTSLVNQLIFRHKGFDSPEQKDLFSQGPWTDVYSLCSTIYYLLTREGIPAIEDRVNYDPVPGLLTRTALPTQKQNALLKGLSIDKSMRYQSIHDFSKAFLGRESTSTDFVNTSYSVHYYAKTDIGNRPINQDNFMIDTLFSYAGEDCELEGMIECNNNEFHIIALSDGVASKNHGELASKASIQAVSHFIDAFQYSDELAQHLMEDLLTQINEKIISLGNKVGKTASTITIFLWKGNEYCVANIGDSPAYHFSTGKLYCLTTAHTLANVKKRTGEPISISDLHTLTHYLGRENIAGSQMASIKSGIIKNGDTFLICSDGIANTSTDLEKKKFLQKGEKKSLLALFKTAHKHKNMDNCTAILLRFHF